MSHRQFGLLVVLGGLAALGVAYWAQYFRGLAPCPLCLWERWPYRIIIFLGLFALMLRQSNARVVFGLTLITLAIAAATAALHVGVEFHWWQSPLPECRGILTPGAPLPAVPARPCDAPAYLVPALPVSMAAMNFIYAGIFACVVFGYLSRKPRRFR